MSKLTNLQSTADIRPLADAEVDEVFGGMAGATGIFAAAAQANKSVTIELGPVAVYPTTVRGDWAR